jgi:hypothetical protein
MSPELLIDLKAIPLYLIGVFRPLSAISPKYEQK